MNIRKVLYASNLALVLVLGYIVVRAVRMPGPLEMVKTPAAVVAQASDTSASAPSDGESYDKILESLGRSSLFGDSEPVFAPDAAGLEMETSGSTRWPAVANLELLGTVAGKGRVGRAVIRNSATNEIDVYRLNDQVNGARIVSIDRNTVVLAGDGRRAALKIKVNSSALQSGQKNENMPPSNKAAAGPPASGRVLHKDLTAGEAGSQGVGSMRGKVNSILKAAVIEPYVVDGKIEGLRLDGLEEAGLTEYLGLRDGDVLRVINGQKVQSKQKLFQIFKKLKNQPQVEIEILRDKRVKNLSFEAG